MAGVFDELDQVLGVPATMSLVARDLVAPVGSGVTVAEGGQVADRIEGALLGAALGSATGYRWEWASYVPRPLPPLPAGARWAADVELLVANLEAGLAHGVGAAPALADRVASDAFRRAGSALRTTRERRRAGAPWFEAAPPSYGNGATLRSIGDGLLWRAAPDRRPVLASIAAAVTHASPVATGVSAVIADLTALLLAQPAGRLDAGSLLWEVSELSPVGAEIAERVSAHLRTGQVPPAVAVADGALVCALWWLVRTDGDAVACIDGIVGKGGDTDTVAALAGALAGALRGASSLPAKRLERIAGVERLRALARRVVSGAGGEAGPEGADDGLHLYLLLDRSGSMASIASDVVGGVNHLLAEHRQASGECRITIVQFDSQDPAEVLVDGADISKVRDLHPDRFAPRGSTPLYDAMGSLLDRAEGEQARRPDEDVLVVIFTDGAENASRRWTRSAIFERVEALSDRGWAFAYLGANQDSYAVSADVGIARGGTANYVASAPGTQAAWSQISAATLHHRGKAKWARAASARNVLDDLDEP